MVDFQILPGLPPYGPPPLSFPVPNAFREGLVVKFIDTYGSAWVGNFAYGVGELTEIRAELGRQATLVVAKGAVYYLDIDRQLVRSGTTVPAKYIEYIEGIDLMVIGNGLWFEALNHSGPQWRTRRISWDGMISIRSNGALIVGEAYSPIGSPDWSPFQIDLRTGETTGGSYNGPE